MIAGMASEPGSRRRERGQGSGDRPGAPGPRFSADVGELDREPGDRLFVAIWPPADMVQRIAGLHRPALVGVRWTTPEQWHVTLSFLGDVPRSRADALGNALAAAARGAGPPPVARLGPSTARFGRSVLGVPVRGLDDLAVAVRGAVDPFAAGVERGDGGRDRRFDGHLTLARGRGGRPVPGSLAGVPLEGSWAVHEVCLVRSQLGAAGARYTTLVRATVPS